MPLKEGSWLIPPMTKKVPLMWKISSKLTLAVVGLSSKLWIETMNKIRVHNRDIMEEVVEKRPKDQGLLTVCNHTSCMDDPLMWGTLKARYLLNDDLMRWTCAAEDICYFRRFYALFFCLGKVFPIVRGDGVYQKGMDFAVEQLDMGKWCHFFPEGKVNLNQEFMRLKWGVGRLVADCTKTPVVLPMWQVGMDDILPNYVPYIPRIGKRVTLLIGKPMDFAKEVESLKLLQKSPQEIRKHVTDRIQEEFSVLKGRAETLHKEFISS